MSSNKHPSANSQSYIRGAIVPANARTALERTSVSFKKKLNMCDKQLIEFVQPIECEQISDKIHKCTEIYSQGNCNKLTKRKCEESNIEEDVNEDIGPMIGTEVRQFYEDLVNVKNPNLISQANIKYESHVNLDFNVKAQINSCIPSCSKLKLKRKSTADEKKWKNKFEYNHNENILLKHAQNGNFKQVKILTEDGVDINFYDTFGWTALTCAAYSGHASIVNYLIQQGADLDRRDYRGLAAVDYAKSRNDQCYDLLNNISRNNENKSEYSQSNNDKSECQSHKVYCKECNNYFHCESLISHQTSTVHLFNRGIKSSANSYTIPQTNIGYQLMVKSGWDENSGLGSRLQGKKAPVKTFLKSDRHGLGYQTGSSKQKRVTHFNANDGDSVKCKRVEKGKTICKKAAAKERAKTKEWERRMRRYLNTD